MKTRPRSVALQVFSYREDQLGDTLDSWAEQTEPEMTVHYHACVTPESAELRDSAISSSMLSQARDHDTFDVIECPPGKLSARNHAHEMAFDNGIDAVIAADADAPPLQDNTLASLCQGLERGGIAGVNSIPKSEDTVLGRAVDYAAWVEDELRPHFNGQCHGFIETAWDYAGPFDESINQQSIREVRNEEEFRFYRDVDEFGHIDTIPEAIVRNDTRRHQQRLRVFENITEQRSF